MHTKHLLFIDDVIIYEYQLTSWPCCCALSARLASNSTTFSRSCQILALLEASLEKRSSLTNNLCFCAHLPCCHAETRHKTAHALYCTVDFCLRPTPLGYKITSRNVSPHSELIMLFEQARAARTVRCASPTLRTTELPRRQTLLTS